MDPTAPRDRDLWRPGHRDSDSGERVPGRKLGASVGFPVLRWVTVTGLSDSESEGRHSGPALASFQSSLVTVAIRLGTVTAR